MVGAGDHTVRRGLERRLTSLRLVTARRKHRNYYRLFTYTQIHTHIVWLDPKCYGMEIIWILESIAASTCTLPLCG